MLAAIVDRYGPPEALVIREVPTPEPGPEQVLVRIHATVVTPSDVAFRNGELWIARLFSGPLKPRLPILGDAFAGTVAAVAGLFPTGRLADQEAIVELIVLIERVTATARDALGDLEQTDPVAHNITLEILEGLDPGASVVASGAGFLADGDTVRVVAAPAGGAR